MTERVVIGSSTLYCGDCRDVMNDLQFDSIITDPPYGLSKVLNRSWQEFGKILNKKQRHKNLHSGGTWAAKEIYQNIDWDNETPDLTFLLERDVRRLFSEGIILVCRQVESSLFGIKPNLFTGGRLQSANCVTVRLTAMQGLSSVCPTVSDLENSQRYIRLKSPSLSCGFAFRSCRKDTEMSFATLTWEAGQQA